MKKSLLLLTALLCLSLVTNAQQVLFDFDTNNAGLGFEGTWTSTAAWPYTDFEEVANPNSSGINTSANVGKYLHLGNAESGLINKLLNGTDPAFNQIDYVATPYIMVKVLVDKPMDVTIKLFNNAIFSASYWPSSTFTQRVTTVNEWVEVVFDLTVPDDYGNTIATNDYDRFTIFFDFDLGDGSVNGDTYYFDDIRTVASIPTTIESINFKNGNGIVDVYNIMGVKVKAEVKIDEALNNLPKGIYIVDGKKYFVNK